ncbi:class I SAM-dependent methyltransferase [Nocardia crassostreae]|uniref:class I SAM-dependent methyltransferase n=1 Tax=Nocardia crassostreae TaxID=53428 RepID=UPI0008344AA3|nr:class I SAM-dependent methyltransferase [Nocardia crassostreae]
MAGNEASRTAVLVCQARAIADGRIAVGRFADPVAARLLREPELAEVERARSDIAPQRLGERIRYETLRATTEILVPRTVAIDDAVVQANNPQLVLLGAGLDARAWRMSELDATAVFEVDHPASQAEKTTRIGGADPVAKSVAFVPVDFGRDALEDALALSGHQPDLPTTWIWEGVMPYLTQSEVERTLDAIGHRSAPSSRLIATYPTPTSAAALLKRWGLRLFLAAGSRSASSGQERLRSAWTPEQIHALFAVYGLDIATDTDLLNLARALDVPVRRSRVLATGRVAVADRAGS